MSFQTLFNNKLYLQLNYSELPASDAADLQLLEQQLAAERPQAAVINELMEKTVVARFEFIRDNPLSSVLEAYSSLREPQQVR